MHKRVVSWLVVSLLLPLAAFAQQTVPPAPTSTETPAPGQPLSARPAYAPPANSGEGRIHLDVVVTDKAGKPVPGLALQDFTLKDNNMPAKILSFHAVEAGTPKGPQTTEVVLLIDAVNLGFQEVARTREQISEFLRHDGGHLAVPVSIFLFTDQGIKVLLQPSIDGNALAAQLDKTDIGLRTLTRSGQYNGLQRFDLSLQWISSVASAEGKRPWRKMLIWAGPGWPLLDRASLQVTTKESQQLFKGIVELSTTLREARMSLYSVSLGDSHLGTFLYQDYLKGVKTDDKSNAADLSLKVLVTQSGGRVMGPDNDIAAQIGSCMMDAGNFYTISFDPPPADKPNEYHDLKVEIDKPGLTARTSTGYYNQP